METRVSHKRGKGRGFAFLQANINFDGEDCLIWPYGKTRGGYGSLGHNGKHYKAHRLMCEMINGPAPEGKPYAAHECGKGHLGCVHPKHLNWKSQDENALDSIRHGTSRKGKGVRHRKLNHDQVLEIIALKGKARSEDLSKIYGVHERHIRLIQSGGSWRGGLPHKTAGAGIAEDLISPRFRGGTT